MTTKYSLQTENRLPLRTRSENRRRQSKRDILSLRNYQPGALEQGTSRVEASPEQLEQRCSTRRCVKSVCGLPS